MTKKDTLRIIVIAVLAVLPIAASIFVYEDLPQTIPAHFNIRGNVDRWGGKLEVFIVPIITVFTGIGAIANLRITQKKNVPYVNKFTSVSFAATVICMIVLNLLTGAILYIGLLGLERIY